MPTLGKIYKSNIRSFFSCLVLFTKLPRVKIPLKVVKYRVSSGNMGKHKHFPSQKQIKCLKLMPRQKQFLYEFSLQRKEPKQMKRPSHIHMHLKTITNFLFQTFFQNSDHFCILEMNNNSSTSQDLIFHPEQQSEDEYYDIDDYDIDESHYFYIINAILSGTARLNVLLPTATILAFSILAPLLTNDGECSELNRWLMAVFLAILAVSCVFFTFTDSFRTASGRLCYGVATFRGIWTFNGGRKKPCVPSDYRLRWEDLFHASLSLVSFLTFAGLHHDVVKCYYPAMPRKVTNTLPLVVGFVVSVLFVVFPSKRRGIGYPFLLQRDPLYSRR